MADDHAASVTAWLQRTTGISREQLIQEFERAFAAVWRRAHVTLGSVTLNAILDRVLYNSAEKYPMLAALTVQDSGLGCQGLHENSKSLARSEVEAALGLVLLEFLTVLGNLTAQVMTPALHAELSRAGRASAPTTDNDSERDGSDPKADGAKS